MARQPTMTCHQPNGKGLDPAFPSIEKSPWVTGDADRLIKLAMYGLMGPLEINGKKYDDQVPMTPFGGMCQRSLKVCHLTLTLIGSKCATWTKTVPD
jgi:hypothetical protein